MGRKCRRGSEPGLGSWPGQQRPVGWQPPSQAWATSRVRWNYCLMSSPSSGHCVKLSTPSTLTSPLLSLIHSHPVHTLPHSYTPHIHTHMLTRTLRLVTLTLTHRDICTHHTGIHTHTRTHPHNPQTATDTHRHPDIHLLSHTTSHSHLGTRILLIHTHLHMCESEKVIYCAL